MRVDEENSNFKLTFDTQREGELDTGMSTENFTLIISKCNKWPTHSTHSDQHNSESNGTEHLLQDICNPEVDHYLREKNTYLCQIEKK